MTTNDAILLVVLLAALAAAVVAAAVSTRRLREQRETLRQRFGPEYERALEKHGGARRAERELLARAERVQRFRVHDLSEADRARLAATWKVVQARFVDDPARAVREADDLIQEVMRLRGYPAVEYEQRVTDLSVNHAQVIDDYRAAHRLAESNRSGNANTEDLRQAVVHYRVLFAALVEDGRARDAQVMREAHA